MRDYEFSSHALKRMEGRNISEELITLALQNGKRKHHGGKTLVKWKNYRIVLSNDGTTVVTAYRRG